MKGERQNTLIVTLGHKELLTGVGAFFIRTSTKAITVANISSDILFGPLNTNILPSLTAMVKNVVYPALAAQENWGVLSRSKDESVKSFMESLQKFTTDLDVAMVNLQDSVQLAPCLINLDAYKRPAEFANAAHLPDIANGLESNNCC